MRLVPSLIFATGLLCSTAWAAPVSADKQPYVGTMPVDGVELTRDE